MVIQGKYSVVASNQVVWKYLMDPEILARITPGITELRPLGGDKYKAISSIKIGPVKGKFEGEMELREKIENTSATLIINQNSKLGNVSAEIKLRLNGGKDETVIDYSGDAKLSGKLAMFGQRIIGGVINSLSREFFKALNNEINIKN